MLCVFGLSSIEIKKPDARFEFGVELERAPESKAKTLSYSTQETRARKTTGKPSHSKPLVRNTHKHNKLVQRQRAAITNQKLQRHHLQCSHQRRAQVNSCNSRG